jgi:hypothetical protein
VSSSNGLEEMGSDTHVGTGALQLQYPTEVAAEVNAFLST